MEIKIPFYNILNMFLTGLIFIGCCILLFPQYMLSFLSSTVFTNIKTGFEIIIVVSFLAVSYEIGLIINRIGSVAIEPLLRKIKLLPCDDNYQLYNKAREKYSIFPTLAREYALSRTSVALFLVLSIISGVVKNWLYLVLFFVVMVIFYFSCAKHSGKIVALMSAQRDEGRAQGN